MSTTRRPSPRPRPLRQRREVRRAARAIRRRRAPEEARREILDAAEQLFAEFHPDALGLKAVARAAGVSHALVTHYFGTYAGLVDAVIERRQTAFRDEMVRRIQATPDVVASATDLFAALFTALGDPVQVRLWLWALATERPAAADLFAIRGQGLARVSAQLAAAVGALRGVPPETVRPDIEVTLLTAVSAAWGYSLGKRALVGALGREPSPALDAAVQTTLRDMVIEHVRHRGLATTTPRST
jgi:AcrR family transcriptional regulator